MKKYRFMALLLAFAVCSPLFACSRKTDDGELKEYATLDKIYSTADDALKISLTNLTMPQSITLDEVTEMYTFPADHCMYASSDLVKSEDETTQYMIDIAKDFAGVEASSNDVEITSLTKDGKLLDYNWIHVQEPPISVMANALNCYYMFGNLEHKSPSGEYITINAFNDIYRVDVGDKLDAVCKMPSGDWTVAEAVECAESYAPTIVKYLPYFESVRVKTALVGKNSIGGDVIEIIFECLIFGMPVDESAGSYTYDPLSGVSETAFVNLIFDDINHIYELRAFPSGIPHKDAAVKCEDKFITLSSAAKLLSDYLAERNKFNIIDININYCAMAYQYFDTEKEENNVAPNISEINYRPMWTFTLDQRLSESYLGMDDCRVMGYVDMISGEVYVLDNAYRQLYTIINPNFHE